MVESLALFGLPISEPLTETIEGKDYTVQWFERARFELHPANRPPFNVLAGRLGAEVLAYQGAADPLRGAAWRLASFGLFEAPEAVCPERPATLSFEARRVSGFSGCNNLSGSYRATAETLTFGPPTSTPAACTDEALTRQEREILNRGYEVITRGRPTTVEVIVQPVS
ncbi:MAG: META domain-containing protein [Oscillochloridaceae bacterium]|nr:META domain-containing protein [Oscillochloridaceae bacterium]